MPIQKIIFTTAFGWLILAGVLHIAVDVVSQHLRGVRIPSPETTLYFGLHIAYSLGQILFGAMGLLVTWVESGANKASPMLLLIIASAVAWILFALYFIDYSPPKVMIGIYATLIILAILASPRDRTGERQ